jgi:hypothetical protein
MKKVLFTLFMVFALSGCAGTITPTTNVVGTSGIDTSHVRRAGNACSYYLLGFIGPFGDNSVMRAAKDNGLSKVLYYDQSREYYFLFGRICNRVYGY